MPRAIVVLACELTLRACLMSLNPKRMPRCDALSEPFEPIEDAAHVTLIRHAGRLFLSS